MEKTTKTPKLLSAKYSCATRMKPPEYPTLGRDIEIQFLCEVLLKKRYRNVLLVGPAGCGKTQLVQEVAKIFKDVHFYAVSITGTVAGSTFRGDFEKRILNLFKDAQAESVRFKTPVVLFMDEAHLMMGAGKAEGDPVDLSNVIKSFPDLIVWGATTDREYEEHIAKDPAMVRRLGRHELKVLSRDVVLQILHNFVTQNEIALSEDLYPVVYDLGEEFVKRKTHNQPDISIEILDRAMAHVNFQKRSEITKDDLDYAIQTF